MHEAGPQVLSPVRKPNQVDTVTWDVTRDFYTRWRASSSYLPSSLPRFLLRTEDSISRKVANFPINLPSPFIFPFTISATFVEVTLSLFLYLSLYLSLLSLSLPRYPDSGHRVHQTDVSRVRRTETCKGGAETAAKERVRETIERDITIFPRSPKSLLPSGQPTNA